MNRYSLLTLLISVGLFTVVHSVLAQEADRREKDEGAQKPERTQNLRQVPQVSGTVHLEGHGDRPLVNHQWAGTKGQHRRLEGFALNLDAFEDVIRVEYMCHLQDEGDVGWMTEGSFCGSRGKSRRLEGFAIRLAGPAAAYFSINYQCHLEGTGDTAVVSNGTLCGTRGMSKRLEAMQVWITRK